MVQDHATIAVISYETYCNRHTSRRINVIMKEYPAINHVILPCVKVLNSLFKTQHKTKTGEAIPGLFILILLDNDLVNGLVIQPLDDDRSEVFLSK